MENQCFVAAEALSLQQALMVPFEFGGRGVMAGPLPEALNFFLRNFAIARLETLPLAVCWQSLPPLFANDDGSGWSRMALCC